MPPGSTEKLPAAGPQLGGRYAKVATRNLKFEKFIEAIFRSRMATEDVKDEIVKYVQALETSYTEAVRDLKAVVEKEKAATRKVFAERTNAIAQRTESETLFVECIEEVRKEIMKRRLKTEVYNRKKFQAFERSTEEAREFEESLLRLAQLSKGRVKLEDFTPRDKYHLLDLFVNNERTLLKIYEALFPHRANMEHAFAAQNNLHATAGSFNPSASATTGSNQVQVRSLSNFRTPQQPNTSAHPGQMGAYGDPKPAFGQRNAIQSVDLGTQQRITYENHKMLAGLTSLTSSQNQALPQIAK